MKRIHVQYLAALILFGMTSAVFGQYVWIDEKGIKQYSDVPPPASVPSSRILRQPRGVPSSAATNENPAPPATPNAKPPMTLAEKNADFQKRRAEQAEKEKKAEEEAKQTAAKARNCERARAYQRTLASGERIASTDKNGERTVLSDEQRTRDMTETKNILAECK